MSALAVAWGRVAEVGFDRALPAVDGAGVGLDTGSPLLCLEEIAAGDAGVEKLMRDAKYLQLWPEPSWMADDAIVDAAINA